MKKNNMSTNSSTTLMIVIGNLPTDTNVDEIRSFLSSINVQIQSNCVGGGGIRIIPSIAANNDDHDSSSSSSKQQQMNAYINVVSEQDIIMATEQCDKKLFRNKYPLSIRRTMKKEINQNISHYIRENLHMTCEWIDCNRKFHDRSLFFKHINETHVPTFWSNLNNGNGNGNGIDNDDDENKSKCKWHGCYDNNEFMDCEHFRLHLSLHGFHNQLMNIGQLIMNITVPRLTCYMDNPARNVITETCQKFICGWNGCNADFMDGETFFQHVDYHAIEDVPIPIMAKEKLKNVRFARCQWMDCQAAFKQKFYLKMHLHSHTQRKVVACPVCGELFSTRMAFINHCYRQETPTIITATTTTTTNQSLSSTSIICDKSNDDGQEDFVAVDCLEDDDEHILTIDENHRGQSSIVIRLASSNINLQTTNDPSTTNATSSSSSKSTNMDEMSESILLVNFPITNNQQQQQQQREEEIIRDYQCKHCTKSFHTLTLLREHENKHLRKHHCPFCKYKACHKSHLKEHILFRHSDKYDYQCQFCNQYFKSRRFLQRHIESHKSEKKIHHCTFCEQKFTTFYTMKRHIRMKHLLEEIIFECHLCTKKYNRGNNLSRHLIGKHCLKVANGWTGFEYVKQSSTIINVDDHQQQQDKDQLSTTTTTTSTKRDVYRINPLSCIE